jgi:hypothetical protein
MDSFIVPIYRYEENKPHKVVGTVEHVGAAGKKAFTHVDELWEILNATGQIPKQDKRKLKEEREQRWVANGDKTTG